MLALPTRTSRAAAYPVAGSGDSGEQAPRCFASHRRSPDLTVLRTAYDTNDVAVEVCDKVEVASAYLLEYDFSAR